MTAPFGCVALFDLETTRLAFGRTKVTNAKIRHKKRAEQDYVPGQSRITEIAVVVVDLNLQKTGKSFVQTVNPDFQTDEEWQNYDASDAARITDLRSPELRQCEKLAEVWPNFNKFLHSLSKPICFIAHNGLKFDYFVLSQDIKRCNIDLGDSANAVPEQLVWIDSLSVFQQLDKKYENEINKDLANCLQQKDHRVTIAETENDNPGPTAKRMKVESSVAGVVSGEPENAPPLPPLIATHLSAATSFHPAKRSICHFELDKTAAGFKIKKHGWCHQVEVLLERFGLNTAVNDSNKTLKLHRAEADCLALHSLIKKYQPDFMEYAQLNASPFYLK